MANPANLHNIDYRQPPPARPGGVGIIDCHTHLRGEAESLRLYMQAARVYGVERTFSMTALLSVAAVQRLTGDCVEFIAVPDYRQLNVTHQFQRQWRQDVEKFARLGSRICKFWAAPRLLAEHGLTLDHPWLRPIIDAAVAAGMAFMVHVADPDLWYATRYADAAKFGDKASAYRQLEWFVEYVAPATVVGAHFLGHPEDLDHIDALLATHENLMLDTSATRWIAREVSLHEPLRVRRFFQRHRERILFGSDLVTGPEYDFDHYASRFWVQRMLWESDYDGESPVLDPDAGRVRLRGVNLSDDVLLAIYRDNARRLVAR